MAYATRGVNSGSGITVLADNVAWNGQTGDAQLVEVYNPHDPQGSNAPVSTFTTTTDISTAAAVGPVPTTGKYSQLLSCIIAAGSSALEIDFEEETSATVFFSVFLAANTSIHMHFENTPLQLATINKRWFAKASGAGNARIQTFTTSSF